jgi:chlorobactene glucosyltransferase
MNCGAGRISNLSSRASAVADLLTHLQQGFITFLAVLLLIALSNWFALRRLQSYSHDGSWPRVSILLPARDEARNIAACARSLLSQDYPDFEVLALDDDSADGTGDLLRELAAQDNRLHVLQGRPLPDGWLGKHWACHQLAQSAQGALWLFTDADTVQHPRALRDAVAALQTENADLITALPRQEMRSWGERWIVSILPWSIFCFYPLALAERLRWPPLVMAVGQFMLFRREAYQRIGGHEAVRTHVADDIALAQRLVARGGRWRLLDATERVSCRMYRNFEQAYQGFSKNMFAAFGYNAAAFVAIWFWLGLVFLAPPLLLALWPLRMIASPALPLTAIGMALGLWGLCVWRLRLPIRLLVAYPLSVALAVLIAARSLILMLTSKATWKGRLLIAPR